VDWEKVGQAFQGGANVLAGGLMDKYQRKRDMEDWEKKTDYSAEIDRRQRQALQDLQTNEANHRAFLDMKKKEYETDPELFPVWQAAQGGDENARDTLETTAEFRHFVDSGIPLTAAQVERLINPGAPIPPGVRSRILAGHLKASNEETKRKSEEEGRAARTERDKAMAQKAAADLAEGSTAGRAEVNKTQAETTKLVTDRMEARDKKLAAIQQLDTNILTLQGVVGDKIREKATAKPKAGSGIDLEIATIQGKIAQVEKQKKGLSDDLQREADILKKRRPDLFPEEAPAKPAEVLPPDVQEFLNQLSDVDREEIFKAMKTRPELSQEAIIRAYAKYKQQANPVAPPQGRSW